MILAKNLHVASPQYAPQTAEPAKTMLRAPPRRRHGRRLLLMRNRRGNPRQSPALSIPPTHVADYSTKRNTTSQPPDSNRRASRDVRPSSFVVCQQTASIALVFKRAAPDPSALHPFCSGAAPRNGCSAPQRVQRHATDAFRATCAPRDLCPARRRICNDDNSQTLDERGGSYCFRPQHQPWHPVHRHATNRRSRHRNRRRPGILSTGTRPTDVT